MFQPTVDATTPLSQVTFVVVDLETTGGAPQSSVITEVGAVKLRGGELLGELQTLVDPGQAIPAQITALTGITTGMLAGQPTILSVLPSFLEFAHGATLVAHNAGFDTGFLNANLERHGYPRLTHPVVCTAALARRLVRDEVRDCKLATLAAHLRCGTVPVHRALADARATAEVLHALLERAGSFGVLTLEDLLDFAHVRNTPLFKERRALSDGLPRTAGVYAFRDQRGEVLYVGKATDLRARVRRYFGNDDRRTIVALLREAHAVDHWVCPTPIEAAVREVRLIHAHRPRFNRRSKHPRRAVWLTLTRERYPRLSIVRTPPGPTVPQLGPLGSRRVAEVVAEAVQDALPLRRCTLRLGIGAPRSGATTTPMACVLVEIGRCGAPCDGRSSAEEYGHVADQAAAVLAGDPTPVLERLAARMSELGQQARFEEAGALRGRVQALVAAITRTRRLRALAGSGVLVASRPARAGVRHVVVASDGRLAASVACDGAADLAQTVAALRADAAVATTPCDAAGHALPPATPGADAAERAKHAEDIEVFARWLEGPGAVVHHCHAGLAHPVAGGRLLADLDRRFTAAARTTGRPAAELAAKRLRRAQPADPTTAPLPSDVG